MILNRSVRDILFISGKSENSNDNRQSLMCIELFVKKDPVVENDV